MAPSCSGLRDWIWLLLSSVSCAVFRYDTCAVLMALSCDVDILSMTSVDSALICKLVSPLMASSGISATFAVVSAAILAVGSRCANAGGGSGDFLPSGQWAAQNCVAQTIGR